MEVDSSSGEEQEIPPEPECRSLCDQFAEITGTDAAFALMMLQACAWSLPAALERCYGNDGEAPPPPPSQPPAAATAAAGDAVAPAQRQQLRLMSWNLDGLTDAQLEARTRGAAAVMQAVAPDAVHLQEAAPDSLALLQHLLGRQFDFVDGRAHPDDRYFTATMLSRATMQLSGSEVHVYPGTRMDRTLLTVRAKGPSGVEVRLLNTHLESTRDFAAERKRQLSHVLRALTATPGPALLAGDLNLRDSELLQLGGLPAGVLDAWRECGARPEAEFTWDAVRNANIQGMGRARCRFDRMLAGGGLRALDFQLAGLQRAPGAQMFPSDHWALVGLFQLP